MAEHGFIPFEHLTPDLMAMVESERWDIRAHAVRMGLGIDKLWQDPDLRVRLAVAKRGYYMDEYAKAEEPELRRIVAKIGNYQDMLCDDPDPEVRQFIALDGIFKNKYINDPDPGVRACVARTGWGLDKLWLDGDDRVRAACEVYLTTIFATAIPNPEEELEDLWQQWVRESAEDKMMLAYPENAPLYQECYFYPDMMCISLEEAEQLYETVNNLGLTPPELCCVYGYPASCEAIKDSWDEVVEHASDGGLLCVPREDLKNIGVEGYLGLQDFLFNASRNANQVRVEQELNSLEPTVKAAPSIDKSKTR